MAIKFGMAMVTLATSAPDATYAIKQAVKYTEPIDKQLSKTSRQLHFLTLLRGGGGLSCNMTVSIIFYLKHCRVKVIRRGDVTGIGWVFAQLEMNYLITYQREMC